MVGGLLAVCCCCCGGAARCRSLAFLNRRTVCIRFLLLGSHAFWLLWTLCVHVRACVCGMCARVAVPCRRSTGAARCACGLVPARGMEHLMAPPQCGNSSASAPSAGLGCDPGRCEAGLRPWLWSQKGAGCCTRACTRTHARTRAWLPLCSNPCCNAPHAARQASCCKCRYGMQQGLANSMGSTRALAMRLCIRRPSAHALRGAQTGAHHHVTSWMLLPRAQGVCSAAATMPTPPFTPRDNITVMMTLVLACTTVQYSTVYICYYMLLALKRLKPSAAVLMMMPGIWACQ